MNNKQENELIINKLKKAKEVSLKGLNELDHKRDLITILYDEKKLKKKFGELLQFHLDAIDKEPPEMKILFALINGCKIRVNYEFSSGEYCRFENPGLSKKVLSKLSKKLGIDSETIFSILDSAPLGVVSIIVSVIQ